MLFVVLTSNELSHRRLTIFHRPTL